MRVDELGPGWRSDFILHRHGGEIIECDDCIVVRSPDRPTYYWGNCLVLPHSPRDAELAHWLARFDAEVGARQPESRHVAIGVNEASRGQALPAWASAGFDFFETDVLRLARGELLQPPKPPRGEVTVRPIDFSSELAAIVELQCADAAGYEPAGYRLHREQQMARYAGMHAQGAAHWFALWCDGVPAADCGLLIDGALGRFQHVSTHPRWRRRGLCTALIHAVTQWAFETSGLQELLMCADPHDVAIGIYRSLGYRRMCSHWGMQRYAPEDAGAHRAATLDAPPRDGQAAG